MTVLADWLRNAVRAWNRSKRYRPRDYGATSAAEVSVGNRFARVDRATVLGALEATGSWDPDVLDGRKAALLAEVGFPKLAGIVVIALGLVLLGAPMPMGRLPGGLLVLAGLWLRRRGVANAALVERVFAEHQSGPAHRLP